MSRSDLRIVYFMPDMAENLSQFPVNFDSAAAWEDLNKAENFGNIFDTMMMMMCSVYGVSA